MHADRGRERCAIQIEGARSDACGHDGHAAMLLGTVKILVDSRIDFKGEVRFIFQHTEELFPGGAQEMVGAGVVEGVDFIVGQHLMADLEKGKFAIRPGKMLAASDEFELSIQGKGGHGGMPQDTIESIVVYAQVVNNLQSVVSRELRPFDDVVLTIGEFVGGSTGNVIPDKVRISGTVRRFRSNAELKMPGRMERIVHGVTTAYGAGYSLNYHEGYSPLINDGPVTEKVGAVMRGLYGTDRVVQAGPLMTSEDFSSYSSRVPGTFYFIGMKDEGRPDTYPHHHPLFDIEEDVLVDGVRIFTNLVAELMND